jgi:prepilin-type N-terminal cleavage/methylation domain-containing protein/prepilin-type processing-associated H-X9-DG protein
MYKLHSNRQSTSSAEFRSGFTLIELLVVIAIIAILASILFPVFARARENARRASCQSNLKQIGLGIMMYVQDYDEKYPMVWYGTMATPTSIPVNPNIVQTESGMPGTEFQVGDSSNGVLGHYITWMDIIYPYVKSVQIFRCPSSTDAEYYPDYLFSGAYGGFKSSYFGVPSGITSMAQIQSPSTSAMLWETGAGSGTSYESKYGYVGYPSNIPRWPTLHEEHLGGMNLAFGDGHVKWMSVPSLISSTGAYAGFSSCNLSAPTYKPLCSALFNPFLQ